MSRLDDSEDVAATIDNKSAAGARLRIDRPASAYFYNVVAHGSSQSCFGPASACLAVTPGSSPLEASLGE